jgi:hypothetical protein
VEIMELVDYEEYVVDNGFAEPGKVEFYSVWCGDFCVCGFPRG